MDSKEQPRRMPKGFRVLADIIDAVNAEVGRPSKGRQGAHAQGRKKVDRGFAYAPRLKDVKEGKLASFKDRDYLVVNGVYKRVDVDENGELRIGRRAKGLEAVKVAKAVEHPRVDPFSRKTRNRIKRMK